MTDPTLYSAFSRSTGGEASRLIGDVIRVASGGEVNHAYFQYFDPQLNCWMTMGANANGVTELALPEFLKDREIVKIFRPRFDLWAGLRAHVSQIGASYSYRGLFGMALVEIGRKLGRNWPNIASAPDEVFCSEWVSEVIRTALGGVWLHVADDAIDPAALCAAEEARPDWFDDVPVRSILGDTT